MEATEGLEAALEQLKWVESRLDGAQSLEALRSLFDRVQAVRQSFPADFNLQMSAADLQERLVERGRRLRAGALRPSAAAEASLRPTEEADQVLGPSLPPNVVLMDPKNWKRAVYAGAFFAVLLFAAFFYLIQMARQLNQMGPLSATKQTSEAKPPAATAAAPPPPVTPTLRLYTDLVPGKVSVDGANEVELQDGELTLEKLAEGHHQVRLTGPSGNASFEFEVQAKHSPQLAGAPSADNAMIVAVSAQGGDGQLATNAIPAQVVLDGKVAGDVGQDGLHLSALGTSDHDLEIRRPHDQQRFILTYTSAPVLTVFVKSDPNAGSLLVITGEDDAAVLINGKRYGRLTQHGALRIPSLKVGTYTISVIKPGFLDAPPSVVQVSQGVESRAEFHLLPVPQVGTLQITGAQPGTTVFLDGDLLATIGADGSAMLPSIKSGEHGIDLRREGSVTKHFTRIFVTGQMVVLSGTDVTLEKAPPPEPRPAPPSSADTAASKAPAPEAKEVVTLAAGERIQSGGGYVSFHVTRTQGQYSFWARMRKGGHLLHRDRLQWFAGYQDEKNLVLFQVDGKHLVVRDIVEGKGTDKRRIPFEADPHQWVQVEMTVTAGGVAVRVRQPGETWVDAGSLPSEGRDFTQGRMGFLVSSGEEIGVRNFQFVK